MSHLRGLDDITQRFLAAVSISDGQALLAPFLQAELELRKVFVQEPTHPILKDSYVGLVDLLSAPQAIRRTKARIVPKLASDEELYEHFAAFCQEKWKAGDPYESLFARHAFCLPPSLRRADGELYCVDNLEGFLLRWRVFTGGSLGAMNWDNVVAAGGSVLACLQPYDVKDLGDVYHESTLHRCSDIDLFIWGLDERQAKDKIEEIYQSVKSVTFFDLVCVRKKNVVSIHARFPSRPIQIILRLYRSPAEILAGFDIDCACVAFDGAKVIANPRAIVAMMSQCNTIDISRRSRSYEMRLRKYADRGFEISVPTLDRSRLTQTVYSPQSGLSLNGLGKLMALEYMKFSPIFDKYRLLQLPPSAVEGHRKGTIAKIMDADDYDPAIFFVPYGPTWNAQKIREFCSKLEKKYKTYGMVQESKNGGAEEAIWDDTPRYHRHVLVCADSMEQCLQDVCNAETCPQPPRRGEREFYIPAGPLRFITENPGRQLLSGSFNPINDAQWEADAYRA